MRGEILDGHQMSGRKPKSADPKRLSSAQMRRTGTLEEWRNPAAAVQCRNRNTVGTEDPTGKATAESMSVTAKRRIEMSRRYRQSRRRDWHIERGQGKRTRMWDTGETVMGTSCRQRHGMEKRCHLSTQTAGDGVGMEQRRGEEDRVRGGGDWMGEGIGQQVSEGWCGDEEEQSG